MTVGDCFAGIGGFSLAFQRAGFDVRWQIEKDDWCQRVLAKHWPAVQRYEDIRDVNGHEIEPVDVVCGGFPCQPFSSAGKRKGTEDDRYLWPEMLRVIREVRPRYVLGENVAGLVTLDGGVVLDGVLSDLEGEGYEVLPPLVIPACAVDAKHRRDRVWIIAYSGEVGWGAGERDVRKGQSDTERSRQTLAHAPSKRCGEARGNQYFGSPQRAPGSGDDVAHPPFYLPHGTGSSGKGWWSESSDRCEPLAYSNGARPQGHGRLQECAGEWAAGTGRRPVPSKWLPEPRVGRVANGIPRRVDRLRGLGNAIVPQVAEQIAWAIRSHAEATGQWRVAV